MLVSLQSVALAAGVMVLAGAVQGACGFGFGLVAVSLLALVMPFKQASVLLVFAALGLNVYILFRLRGDFRLDRLRPLILAAVLGVPLGVWLLVSANETVLRLLLGILLLATVAQRFVPGVSGKRWHPLWLGIPCGLFSGMLSGAFATGGPPVVAYVQSQHFNRHRYVAGVQAPLAVSAVTRVICLGATDFFTARIVLASLAGVACAAIGATLGLYVLQRLPDRIVRAVVLAMLFVLGIRYILF